MGKLELNQLFCMDCVKGMKQLPADFVDMVLSSPPYGKARIYDEQYTFDFPNIAKQLYRVCKPGATVCWNVNDTVEDGSKTLESFRQALYFKKIGFKVHDVMIFHKNAVPHPSKTRYAQVFEYVFILSKDEPPKYVNLIKDQEKKEKKSTWRNHRIREKDGSQTVERKHQLGERFRVRDTIWKYHVGFDSTTKDADAKSHPALMPEQLAKDLIESWSKPNDIVLDPLAGASTTLAMAKLMGRRYIGFEISEQYQITSQKRLQKISTLKDAFEKFDI